MTDARGTLTMCLFLLAVAACGSSTGPERAQPSLAPPSNGAGTSPAALPPPPAPACPDAADRPFSRALGRAEGTGFSRGTGPKVVILSHQSRGTPCDLAALGHALASASYRVVAWDAGIWTNQDTLSRLVADERHRGATWVALIGASAGGATSIGAAAIISPRVDALVALSPSGQSEMYGDVVLAAATYAGPLMVLTGELDSAFAGIVPDIAAAHGGVEDIEVLPGVAEHGKSLVPTPNDPEVARILGFLERAAS